MPHVRSPKPKVDLSKVTPGSTLYVSSVRRGKRCVELRTVTAVYPTQVHCGIYRYNRRSGVGIGCLGIARVAGPVAVQEVLDADEAAHLREALAAAITGYSLARMTLSTLRGLNDVLALAGMTHGKPTHISAAVRFGDEGGMKGADLAAWKAKL